MPEAQSSPEKTPYEQALDSFFRLLRASTGSQSSIKASVASMLEASTSNTFNRLRYLDELAERHEFDVDGILVEAGGQVEVDTTGQAHESDNDYILVQKIRLLSDVTALVVGSEHSTLTDAQKEEMLVRVYGYLDARWPKFTDKSIAREMHYAVGEAAAVYVARDVELAEMGDDREERVRRGRFALRILGNHGLIRNDRRNALGRALRAARRA